MSAHECSTFDPKCWRCDLNLDELGYERPSVPPSSAGSVRTEGPTGVSGPQNGSEQLEVGDLSRMSVEAMSCGGCRGLGSHRRWCSVVGGFAANRMGHQAEAAENLGDQVGANHPGAANALYAAAGLLRAGAEQRARAYRLAADMIEEEQA